MKKDKDLMKKEAEDLFEFPVNLVAPERIVRDPNKLKVDYMVLARFCALGANLSESAFSLGTTIKALEIRIKKDLDMCTMWVFYGNILNQRYFFQHIFILVSFINSTIDN